MYLYYLLCLYPCSLQGQKTQLVAIHRQCSPSVASVSMCLCVWPHCQPTAPRSGYTAVFMLASCSSLHVHPHISSAIVFTATSRNYTLAAMILTAVQFITQVSTVVTTIAVRISWNASPIAALELIWVTVSYRWELLCQRNLPH